MDILLTSVILAVFIAALIGFLIRSRQHQIVLVSIRPSIESFHKELESLSKQYIANSHLLYLKKKYLPVYQQVKSAPNSLMKKEKSLLDFLTIYNGFEQWVEDKNENFINQELKDCTLFFRNIDGKALDRQQQEAVVVNEDNTLVLAGAGSGKTLTISAKVKYLVERLGVHPDEILLISFTSKSAKEMTERIQGKLSIPIQAKTFHKLGLEIITNANQARPEIQNDLLQFINNYFSKNILNNSLAMADIIYFYGFYLVIPKDIEKFDTLGEFHDDQASIDLETLRSKLANQQAELRKDRTTLKLEKVKSLEEVLIANFLYLNGIKYEYEALYPYQGDKYRKRYRPDFYLPEYGIYLEHFGITETNTAPWLTPIEEKKYIEDMEWKREWHQKNNTRLIETYSYFNKEGLLLEKLKNILISNGVNLNPIDLSDAYKSLFVKRQEEQQFREFKGLVSTFITLFKSNGYEDINFMAMKNNLHQMNNPFHKERTQLFLSMVQPIFKKYQKHLQEHGSIDFNDMINHATSIVNNSDTDIFGYKYIIIDEYQDISMNRFRLVKAIKEMTNARVLCVGDDWQSIFRFAGSDLQLFINFKKYFGYTKLLKIEKTYRNSQELIDVAGNFVMTNERQYKKDLTSFKRVTNPVRIFGYGTEVMKAFTSAVDSIVKEFGDITSIMVIGRHRFDIKYLIDRDESKSFLYQDTGQEIIISSRFYPRVKFQYATAHGSKGLEAENVILINLANQLLGFPNKISDDPLLSLVLTDNDDFSYAEERRLFYVALTRTKNYSFLVTPQENMSVFVEELIKELNIPFEIVTGEKSIRENPNCPVCQTGKMVIRTSEGRNFLGCWNYPKCSYTNRDIGILTDPIKCTTCGGFMTIRKGPRGEFYGCTNYPLCRNSFDKIS